MEVTEKKIKNKLILKKKKGKSRMLILNRWLLFFETERRERGWRGHRLTIYKRQKFACPLFVSVLRPLFIHDLFLRSKQPTENAFNRYGWKSRINRFGLTLGGNETGRRNIRWKGRNFLQGGESGLSTLFEKNGANCDLKGQIMRTES